MYSEVSTSGFLMTLSSFGPFVVVQTVGSAVSTSADSEVFTFVVRLRLLGGLVEGGRPRLFGAVVPGAGAVVVEGGTLSF